MVRKAARPLVRDDERLGHFVGRQLLRIALSEPVFKLHGIFARYKAKFEALLSAHYVATAILHDREMTLAQFESARYDDPKLRRFAEQVCGASLSAPPQCSNTQRPAGAQRLRIGYLSADFREHPVSLLLARTIELHDRERFEVFGYSYGVDDSSALRRRVRNAYDTFRDVASMSDAAAARATLTPAACALASPSARIGCIL